MRVCATPAFKHIPIDNTIYTLVFRIVIAYLVFFFLVDKIIFHCVFGKNNAEVHASL